MDRLNTFLTAAGEVLLAPFRQFPATGLVFWSVLTGIVMTYVFGKTSNQQALRRAADNIRAQLFAVKLFKDDLFVTFQCQTKLLGRHNIINITGAAALAYLLGLSMEEISSAISSSS